LAAALAGAAAAPPLAAAAGAAEEAAPPEGTDESLVLPAAMTCSAVFPANSAMSFLTCSASALPPPAAMRLMRRRHALRLLKQPAGRLAARQQRGGRSPSAT